MTSRERSAGKAERTSTVERYLVEVADAVRSIDVMALDRFADVLLSAWRTGATVYVLGNGGSGALASHMATDLGKNTSPDLGTGPREPAARRLRMVALTDNCPLITALGNDVSYADVFVEQLKGLLRPGDVVVGISGSGASPNVVRALEYARLLGAATVGLTGSRPSATAMLAWSDCAVVVPSVVMEQIEDLHSVVNHVLAVHLRELIASRIAG